MLSQQTSPLLIDYYTLSSPGFSHEYRPKFVFGAIYIYSRIPCARSAVSKRHLHRALTEAAFACAPKSIECCPLYWITVVALQIPTFSIHRHVCPRF